MTKLVRASDYRAVGKGLIAQAHEEQRDRMQRASVAIVSQLIEKISIVERNMERDKESLKIYNGRLKAIETGEFSIKFQSGEYTEPQTGSSKRAQIIYNDDSLNVQR